ncbi:polysaccharide deacetylase family protein [Paenibacillus filicis]|uniref:Polysaccharide deacetylase family protein n=2 Tax=Paenibacillus filicis TaxID=669464 RepID=A0ABU9DRE0_9BACL
MSTQTYTVCMIELLALKQDSTCYKLELGVTRDEGYARCEIEIDEYTYKQLAVLDLSGSGRVRLSPFTRWDPFQQKHYTSLVVTRGIISQTFYFVCSVLYKERLTEIKENRTVMVASVGQVPSLSEQPVAVRVRSQRWKASKRHGLGMIGFVVILMLATWLAIDKEEGVLTAGPSNGSEQAVTGTGNGAPIPAELASLKVEFNPVLPASADSDDAIKPSAPSHIAEEAEVVVIEEGDKVTSLPEGYVALTFDDGPSTYTRQIVDILVEHGVGATFFFIGENARHRQDMVTYAREHNMSIGSHSWSHKNLATVGSAEQKKDLSQTNELLEPLVHMPVTLFRPPYGSLNKNLLDTTKSLRMKMVLWNRDPMDWTVGKKAEDLIQYFKDHDPSKGIYVMHEKAATVEALPGIIQYLKKQNLKFVIFQ